MSKACATYPFVGAFKQAQQIVGEIRKWLPSNPEHERFLKRVLFPGSGDYHNIPELASIASWSADEINKFMADHGFDISLNQFQDREYGIASIFELLLKFATPGKDYPFRTNDGLIHPCVLMSDHTDFRHVPGYGQPLAVIKTENGDSVYMMMTEEPSEDMDLIEMALYRQSHALQTGTYKGLIFPKVDLNLSGDVGWLTGLGFTDGSGVLNVIAQAKQQNIFKMNEEGALAKSAVAASAVRCALPSQPMLIINQPFLVWISRPGFYLPLFVAYVTEEDWKDPGELK